jgi:two-component system response regulator AtoC
VMCTDSTILPEHLPPSLLAAVRADPAASAATAAVLDRPSDLPAEMKSLERTRIIEALGRCDGNQSEAARQLGMPRRTLVSRLTALGLTRRRIPADESE